MEVIPYLLERRPRHPFPTPSPTLDAARVNMQEGSEMFAEGFRVLDKELVRGFFIFPFFPEF